LQVPQKFTQIRIFGLKICHLATLVDGRGEFEKQGDQIVAEFLPTFDRLLVFKITGSGPKVSASFSKIKFVQYILLKTSLGYILGDFFHQRSWSPWSKIQSRLLPGKKCVPDI
jgi:hypothetical protein